MRSRSLVLAISVCLLVVGLFFLGRIFLSSSGGAKPDSVDTAILEQAKREVPEPVLPPAPAGSTVAKSHVQVVRSVPTIKWTPAKVGLAAVQISKTVVEKQNQSVEVNVAKGTGANAAEVAAWNRQAAAAQKDYNMALNAKMENLVAAKKSSSSGSGEMEAVTDLIEKAIVPLITSITGLILAIKSLRNPKDSPSAS